jgi:large subunit ribosomal protein L18
MNKFKQKSKLKLGKARHVRRTLGRDLSRPRLSVFKSRANIYCQIIDDREGRTLCAAGTLDPDIRDSLEGVNKTDAAVKVGIAIAARAKEKGITRVKFDRGPNHYCGRVAALATEARKGGLEF